MTAANIAFSNSFTQRLPHRVLSDLMAPEQQQQQKIVLAFDLYGTILSTASIAHALANHFGEDKANAIAVTWRTLQLEYTWRLNSVSHYQPFSTVTRNSLEAALKTHGVSLNDKETDSMLDEYNNLHLFPDVGPALEALPRTPGVEAYIFTNGTDAMVSSSLKKSPDLGPLANVFKSIVTVEETRKFKPSPDVYWHLVAKVGKTREEAGSVWLISGNPFDVVGAKTLGLKTCWVDREGKGWSDRLVSGLQPDLIVKGLGEVVEKVQTVVSKS